MEKDELLDIAYKTEVRSQKSEVRGSTEQQRSSAEVKRNYHSAALLPYCSIIFCLLLTGCSFPRIIVLDDPLTPEEHINLGVAYERKGELDNAIEEFKKASKKLPVAYLYLGNVYMQKGNLDEAEKYYRKAIKKQPDLADAYNNLAWLYYTRKENLEEAEGLVLKALELSPSNENYKDTLNRIKELKSKNGL